MELLLSDTTTNILLLIVIVLLWQLRSARQDEKIPTQPSPPVAGDSSSRAQELIIAQLKLLREDMEAIISEQRRSSNMAIREVEDEDSTLNGISTRLSELERLLSEVAENTTPEHKRELKRFRRALPLSLDRVSVWKKGDIRQLIEWSVFYPSEEPIIRSFTYQHDRFEEVEDSERGHLVMGRTRTGSGTDLSPFEFFVGSNGARTSSMGGEIREL